MGGVIDKNFPGGPVELEVYRQEVIDGIHDHWVDPDSGKWTYTYHQRLAASKPMTVKHNGQWVEMCPMVLPFNQLDYMVDKLTQVPYTRRAQAITWMPTCDPATGDPPCFQRIWARILSDERGNLSLNMNAHWRSRDLWKA